MKRILLFFSLISLNAVSSEREFKEFKALIERQNNQTVAMVTVMGAIGVGKLLEYSTQMCGTDSLCLRVSIPVVCSAVLAGTLCYKKFSCHKGIA